MVSVVIRKNRVGHFIGFVCSGHADFAEKGSDIVCAGISSLTHSTILALDQLTDVKMKVRQNARKGFLECDWSNSVFDQKVDLILQVMRIGLNEIQKQYPDYFELSEVEV